MALAPAMCLESAFTVLVPLPCRQLCLISLEHGGFVPIVTTCHWSQVFRELRDANGGIVALPPGLEFEDPGLAAGPGEVDIEGILANRATWHTDHGDGGNPSDALAGLSLSNERDGGVTGQGQQTRDEAAAAEVAASAAAGATPTPDDDEWMYRDPQGEIRVRAELM